MRVQTIQYNAQTRCKTCNGSGAAPGSKPTQCKTCKGTGQVTKMQGGFMLITSTCPTCGGQGTYISTPCSSCGGEGTQRESHTAKVRVPAGVESGTVLKIPGMGDQSASGRTASLLVVINVLIFFLRACL
jgi:molecular chaperone DnaJ